MHWSRVRFRSWPRRWSPPLGEVGGSVGSQLPPSSPCLVTAAMSSRQVRTHCKPEPDAEVLLKTAIQRLGLPARAYDRVLKLSRTIADLVGGDDRRGARGGGDPVPQPGPAALGSLSPKAQRSAEGRREGRERRSTNGDSDHSWYVRQRAEALTLMLLSPIGRVER
jgi:hypothetical protein